MNIVVENKFLKRLLYILTFLRHEWFCPCLGLEVLSSLAQLLETQHAQLRLVINVQFDQRVRTTSERPAGQLDCHIHAFLNGTRHPCLATRHSHQARNKNVTISRLWVNYQCAGLYPSLRTSPQCNDTSNPASIRTWVDSTLRVASQRSNQFGQRVRPTSERLAGQLDCHRRKNNTRVMQNCTLIWQKCNKRITLDPALTWIIPMPSCWCQP